MLHLFSLFDESFAFDTESGALLSTDALSREVLSAWLNQGGEPSGESCAAIARHTQSSLAEVQEALAEIRSLQADGTFFRPAPPVRVEQLYPDQPRIKAMCLHICHDCNLRCRYCFAGQGDYHSGIRSMLSWETARNAIDFLIRESGPRRHLDVDFFGGEPLMNWPVVEKLVAYCESEGPKHGKTIRLTITTNALLLNDARMDFINAHFKNVVLSIDGRQAVHDRMRPDALGNGTWIRVRDHIARMVAKRGQREFYLRGTYTAYNKDFAADVLALAEIADQISIEPVVGSPDEPWALHLSDLPVLEKEYEKLAWEINRRREEGHAFHFFHFMIDPAGHSPCIYKRLKGCGVGSEYCAVTPQGDIYPCHQLVGESPFLMGNVNAGGLDREHHGDVLEAFRRLLVPDKPECQNCFARYYCGGGCVSNAWHAGRGLEGTDPMTCALLRKRLECALWLEAKAMQRKAEKQEAERA